MSERKIPENFAFQIEEKAEHMPDYRIVTFENGVHSDEILTYGGPRQGG